MGIFRDYIYFSWLKKCHSSRERSKKNLETIEEISYFSSYFNIITHLNNNCNNAIINMNTAKIETQKITSTFLQNCSVLDSLARINLIFLSHEVSHIHKLHLEKLKVNKTDLLKLQNAIINISI